MKKVKLIILYIAFMVFSVQECLAVDGLYVSAQGENSNAIKKADITIASEHAYRSKLKNSTIFGVSLGGRIQNNLFTELEYSYAPNYSLTKSYGFTQTDELGMISSSTKIKSHSFFANLNYLIKNDKICFTPYITAGVGLAKNRVKNVNSTMSLGNELPPEHFLFKGKDKINFAWQIGIGTLIPLNNSLEGNIAIKYKELGRVQSSLLDLNTNSVHDSLPVKARLSVMNFIIGLKYKF